MKMFVWCFVSFVWLVGMNGWTRGVPGAGWLAHEWRPITSHRVGVVLNRCCLPGRRYGCDPANFGQSGCVSIRTFPNNCVSAPERVMNCTGATCLPATNEDKCEVNIRTVTHNRCTPRGVMTTNGCPVDQWQCRIDMQPYFRSDAPKSDVLVCDEDIATLCAYTFQVCD